MTQRRTYEDVLIARGDDVLAVYTCSCCGHVGPAFTFAETEPEDGLSVPFACAECILSAHRAAATAEAEDAAAVAGLDWSGERARRDVLLTRCDWTQMADAPLEEEQREAWRAYRQLLRDLPDQFPGLTDPAAVVWPDPPA